MRLEDVRQRDEVDALRGERHLQRVGGDRGAGLEGEGEAVRDAALPQEIDLGQADLHRPVPEHVIDGTVKLCKLPVEDVGTLGGSEPR